jgi:pimeloyl-ACP methyl ester carboxylesterase
MASNPDASSSQFLEFRRGAFVDGTKASLDGFFAGLEVNDPDGKKPLVIHFHGGLVSFDKAKQGAERLDRTYRAAGALPLFVIWNSALGDAIETLFGRIVGEPIYRRTKAWILRAAGAKDRQGKDDGDGSHGKARGGTDGFSLLPDDELFSELAKANEDREPFDDHTDRAVTEPTEAEREVLAKEVCDDPRLAAAFAQAQADGGLIDPDLLKTPDADVGKERGFITAAAVGIAAAAVFWKVVQRRMERTDHGLYPTVVEELIRRFFLHNFGKYPWKAMKDDAESAFGNGEDCGGSALVRAVKAIRERGDGRRIVLVGHSAGSIWIAHWLRRAKALGLDAPVEVVLLAPACTFELFGEALDAGKDQIKAIRVFTMTDKYESRDRVAGMAYPRSLLYLVSGLFEAEVDTPLLGMERFMRDSFPQAGTAIPTVASYLAGDTSRQVWSVTAANASVGFRTAATSHGAFDDEPLTLESLQYIVRHGFV